MGEEGASCGFFRATNMQTVNSESISAVEGSSGKPSCVPTTSDVPAVWRRIGQFDHNYTSWMVMVSWIAWPPLA